MQIKPSAYVVVKQKRLCCRNKSSLRLEGPASWTRVGRRERGTGCFLAEPKVSLTLFEAEFSSISHFLCGTIPHLGTDTSFYVHDASSGDKRGVECKTPKIQACC